MLKLFQRQWRRLHGTSDKSTLSWNDPHPSLSRIDPMTIEDMAPLSMSAQARIELAVTCRDADPIPKVRGAGRIISLPDGRRVQIMHNGVRVVVDGYYGAFILQLQASTRLRLARLTAFFKVKGG